MKKIILVLLIALNLYGFTETDSLVAWYKLSSSNYGDVVADKFTDLSGNGNHAESFGTVTYTTDHLGNANSAMVFDGATNYLNCGNSDAFNIGTDDFTYMFWFSPDYNADKDAKVQYYLYSKYQDNNNTIGYRIKYSYLHEFHVYQGGTDYRINSLKQIPTEFERFQLYGIVFDTSDSLIYIYKNGYLVEIDDSSFPLDITNTGDFLIGKFGGVNEYYKNFKGDIEEFWVYNRMVSSDEMLDIFDDYSPHIAYETFETVVDWADEPFWDDVINKNAESTGATFTYITTDVYNGTYSGKSSVPSHPTEQHARSQLSLDTGEYGDLEDGQEAWISLYWRVDAGFSETDTWNGLAGAKYNFDAGEEDWGVYSLKYLTGELSPYPRFWDEDGTYQESIHPWEVNHQGVYFPPDEWGVSITKGDWYNIVYHWRASLDSTGFFEAWVNGKSVFPEYFDEVNDNGAYIKVRNHRLYGRNLPKQADDGLNFKFGYYQGDYTSHTNSMYFDEIKIGLTAKSIGFMQEKVLTIDNQVGSVGDTLIIPILINAFLDDDNVKVYSFELEHDENIEIIDYDLTGAVTNTSFRMNFHWTQDTKYSFGSYGINKLLTSVQDTLMSIKAVLLESGTCDLNLTTKFNNSALSTSNNAGTITIEE